MSHDTTEMNREFVETQKTSAIIGKEEDDLQITVSDTGWTDQEKEHMQKFGYDSLDMIRAWYS